MPIFSLGETEVSIVRKLHEKMHLELIYTLLFSRHQDFHIKMPLLPTTLHSLLQQLLQHWRYDSGVDCSHLDRHLSLPEKWEQDALDRCVFKRMVGIKLLQATDTMPTGLLSPPSLLFSMCHCAALSPLVVEKSWMNWQTDSPHRKAYAFLVTLAVYV